MSTTSRNGGHKDGGKKPPTSRGAPVQASELERRHLKAELAKRLMAARLRKKWSQSELARQAAKHMPGDRFGRDNVSKWENKGNNILPSPLYLNAISKALDVEPHDLLPSLKSRALSAPIKEFDLRAVGDDTMWLRINQPVSTKDAMKIVDILQKAKQ